ncbi:hypothetical protein ANRL1_00046 [Anaerolineae bacterium]|nr:hypothetical protein ANRL1_00046 [Anaerolineae bacterium]
MGIPIGMQYSQQVSGAALKQVTCEYCRTKYFYFAERTAEGRGSSLLFLDNEGGERRAEEAAARNLQSELAKAMDLSPCPKCLKFQSAVITRMRGRLYKYAGAAVFVGLFPCLLVGVFAMGKSMNPGVAVGLLIGICTVLAFGGAAGLAAAFNPNQGKWFPFGMGEVRQSLTQEDLDAMEAEANKSEEEQRVQLEAEQSERRERALAAKAEAAKKKEAAQEAARARKEEEMRKMAERAKASNRKPV